MKLRITFMNLLRMRTFIDKGPRNLIFLLYKVFSHEVYSFMVEFILKVHSFMVEFILKVYSFMVEFILQVYSFTAEFILMVYSIFLC